MPEGSIYSSEAKPPEGAQVYTTDRGAEYWIAGKKDKTKTKQAKDITELRNYVKENNKPVYEAMQQALPDLSDDQLKEQITGSKKHIRGIKGGGKDSERATKIHQLAVAMSQQELRRRQEAKQAKPKRTALQSEGLNRVWLNHPVLGKETIGEWLERQGVKQDEDGKFIFYHGTPKVGGATDSLREGSYLGFSEDFSRHQTQRDKDIGEEDVIVHELHLSPDEINPGVYPTLRKPIEIKSSSSN